MSFKSLLFCPDDKTARVVTQVLTELDFTVEPVGEAFAAVKRLTDEHFDALVVDCQNEQDASLLYKAARNSTHNSSSLSVAVVEGQAGVAKAFRIGANLVLTKPINIEQSKSTLRVARGLLRKSHPKPVSTAPVFAGTGLPANQRQTARPDSVPSAPISNLAPSGPTSMPVATTALAAQRSPAAIAETASVPFSGLELEHEPELAPEAADAAVLESLAEPSNKPAVEKQTRLLVGTAEPFAVSVSGQAAAPALAPEIKPSGLLATGAAPMVTQEAIVRSEATAEVFDAEPVEAPTFATLETTPTHQGGGTSRVLKIALFIAAVGGAGYFASQKLPLSQYVQQLHLQELLHRGSNAEVSHDDTAAVPSSANTEHITVQPVAAPTATPAETQKSLQPSMAAATPEDLDTTPPPATSHKSASPETIEVQELPLSRDSSKSTSAPKPAPQPLLVRNDSGKPKAGQPAPPPVNIADLENTNATLPNLVPENVALPKPAPGVVRISQGVSQGLLIKKVAPIYPRMAQQFQREGTVQLLATIDKHGAISKIQVLSGDTLFAKSAVDAVRQWQYRPYLLNGQPVEIETQITVAFKVQK